jgi:hypothetical protein
MNSVSIRCSHARTDIRLTISTQPTFGRHFEKTLSRLSSLSCFLSQQHRGFVDNLSENCFVLNSTTFVNIYPSLTTIRMSNVIAYMPWFPGFCGFLYWLFYSSLFVDRMCTPTYTNFCANTVENERKWWYFIGLVHFVK